MKQNAYYRILRPHQWLKNLLLLFPPFLGGTLTGVTALPILLALGSFSAAASMVYVLNDLTDIESDRNHPRKKFRPLASGELSGKAAVILALLLGLVAFACATQLSIKFVIIIISYIVVSLAYSWRLKNIPLVELFCVVSGFLLRLMAGGEAFGVTVSDWLFLSVFLLALFLVSGKRLSELRHEGGESSYRIRPVLADYPQGFLEGAMLVSGAAVLVTYTLYVIGHQRSIWVIPICCFGLLAFFRRVLSGRGGDPTHALLRDPMLFLSGLSWVVFVAWEIYGQLWK
ncbi:MAG: decaprenyl-phosphate phosphoribosyltransferase [Desulfuromonas sp.]|nr:MAG: decaprenyl-phosphate phosphoribosyltransferase [Desulfuromonas sp.]